MGGRPWAIPRERLVNVHRINYGRPLISASVELINALFFVDEMATDELMDQLLIAAKGRSFTLELAHEHTPADIAVQVWLKDPGLLERKHAERQMTRIRSYESFVATRPLRGWEAAFTAETVRDLERGLDNVFEEKQRGRTAKVSVFPRTKGIWFMVRHGEPFRREERADGPPSASVSYRPVKYDIVRLKTTGELRINAQTAWQKDLYRQQFGSRLFGCAELFQGRPKYTLEPLRTSGKTSLHCMDVPGIEVILLRGVHLLWGGSYHEQTS